MDASLFANDPASIDGYVIVQEQRITDAKFRQELIDLLNSRSIYGNVGAACFSPGIAIRLGEGDRRIDVLICLDCQHVYFYRGDRIEYRNLNSNGIDRIKHLYSRLFPGHLADSAGEDTKKAAATRKRERERRLQELHSNSKPATEPSP